jgi:hypothetical protein
MRDITDSHLALIPAPDNGKWKADKNLMHSYSWTFGPEKKEKLIGSELYLHKHRAEGAYIGGIIKDYFQDQGQPDENRVVLVFETDSSFTGVKAGTTGWGPQHMKTVES